MQQGDSSPTDRIAALSALYSADRQDTTALVNARLALLALQLTYMGLMAVVLSDEQPSIGPWLAAFSAFPLWFMHSYHVILVAVSMARINSVGALEDELFEHSGLPAASRNGIGVRAGERMADISRQPTALKIQAGVTYGGVGAVMITFSVYALTAAARGGAGVTPVILAGLLYLALFVAAVVAWLRIASLPRSDQH